MPDRKWLRRLPWLALVVALVLTSAGSYYQDLKMVARYEQARADYQAQFDAIVQDHERRIRNQTREISLILSALTWDDVSGKSYPEMDLHLRELGVAGLPGIEGVLFSTTSGLSVVSDFHGRTVNYLHDVRRYAHTDNVGDETWVWVDEEFVVVGERITDDIEAMALFAHDGFLVDQGMASHRVSMTLTPTAEGSTAVLEDGSVPRTYKPIVVHAYSGSGSFSPDSAEFVSNTKIQVFNQLWEMEVASFPGFGTPDTGGEIAILTLTGILLSLAIFIVIYSLVESRIAIGNELFRSAQRLAVGFDESPLGVGELDEERRFVVVNDAMAKMFGSSPDKLRGRPLAEVLGNKRAAEVLSLTNDEVHYEFDDGRQLWVRQKLSPVSGPDGSDYLMFQVMDTTEQRKAHQELEYRALHDDLTGLPNRALLEDRIETALNRSKRGGLTAVLFIDLDLFKKINDTLGHRVGDGLLIEIADRLRAAARLSDTVCRFGGDEFVVVCDGVETVRDAERIAHRLLDAVVDPMIIDNNHLSVSCSIGVAVADGDDTCEAVMRDADAAMYEAKASGRNQVMVFDLAMRNKMIDHLSLGQELQEAIINDELTMVYQPILSLSNDHIIGFEATVRWTHPKRGTIESELFLADARRTGFITDIDRFAVRTAVNQLTEWSRTIDGAGQWTMLVSASADSFNSLAYANEVAAVLAQSGLSPKRLTIELANHGSFVSPDQDGSPMDQVKADGVQLVRSDFGLGYSSFDQMVSFDFESMKIDRSIIARLAETRVSTIVQSLIQMAQSLGLAVVAEGVERGQNLDQLRHLGSDSTVGYYGGGLLRADQVTGLTLNPVPSSETVAAG